MEEGTKGKMNQAEPIRTFIALPLPSDWTQALGRTMLQLRRALPNGIRWVDPGGIHLTLKFLGNTDPGLVDQIIEGLAFRLAASPSPQLSLDRLGTFPAGRNPRVIWAGVSGDSNALEALHHCAEAAAVGLGWAPERRAFRPHLTLGRVRDQVSSRERGAIVDGIKNLAPAPASVWRPDVVRLYKSVLTSRGAIYSSLGEVKF